MRTKEYSLYRNASDGESCPALTGETGTTTSCNAGTQRGNSNCLLNPDATYKTGDELKEELMTLGMKYAWVQNVSSVELGKLEDTHLDLHEVLEARIFGGAPGEERELHIFEYDDRLKGVLTETTPADRPSPANGGGSPDSDAEKVTDISEETDGEKPLHYFDRKQVLRRRFGKTITLRHFIDYDPDDGQAFVSRTILVSLEKGRA